MKLCPRCRRRYPNSETACTHDGQRLFPLWYSWIRIWHFGLGLIVFGSAVGYFCVVEPIIEARAHEVKTIYIAPQLIIVTMMVVALGVPFLFRVSGLNRIPMKTTMIIAASLGVCLCVILIVALARLGYPLL